MASKVYTAQEMRALAESKAIVKLHCKSGNLLPRCREWCPADDAKKCQDADDIRAALRYAAEVVERCDNKRKELDEEWFFEGADNLTLPMEECYGIIDYILRGDAGKEKR